MYSALTKAYVETGRLKLAIITCQKALDLDARQRTSLPFARLAYIIMSELLYQTGQMESAENYAEMGLEYIVRHGDVYSIIDGYATLARIQLALDEDEQAVTLVHEMKAVISQLTPSRNAVKIANAWEAYVMLATHRSEMAKAWVREPGFDQLDGKYVFDLGKHTYVGIYRVSQNPIRLYAGFIHLTLARLYLAQNQLEASLHTLEAVLQEVVGEGRVNQQVEALVLKAILLRRLKREAEAGQAFNQAVHLAAREGFVQLFLNEGHELQALLEQAKQYEWLDLEEQVFLWQLFEKLQLATTHSPGPAGTSPDALSGREIEVLRILAEGLSYAKAAETLSISRNTLKTHTKRIYQKLGVNGLLPALNRARELHLID